MKKKKILIKNKKKKFAHQIKRGRAREMRVFIVIKLKVLKFFHLVSLFLSLWWFLSGVLLGKKKSVLYFSICSHHRQFVWWSKKVEMRKRNQISSLKAHLGENFMTFFTFIILFSPLLASLIQTEVICWFQISHMKFFIFEIQASLAFKQCKWRREEQLSKKSRQAVRQLALWWFSFHWVKEEKKMYTFTILYVNFNWESLAIWMQQHMKNMDVTYTYTVFLLPISMSQRQ